MGKGEWQTQRRSQKSRKRGEPNVQDIIRNTIAKEIASSLFVSKNRYSPLSISSDESDPPEWQCKECNTINFPTRKMCRKCGEGNGVNKGLKGGSSTILAVGCNHIGVVRKRRQSTRERIAPEWDEKAGASGRR